MKEQFSNVGGGNIRGRRLKMMTVMVGEEDDDDDDDCEGRWSVDG